MYNFKASCLNIKVFCLPVIIFLISMKKSIQSSVFASIMELSNREKHSLLIDYIQTILINLSIDLYLKPSLKEKWTQIAAEREMLTLNHSLSLSLLGLFQHIQKYTHAIIMHSPSSMNVCNSAELQVANKVAQLKEKTISISISSSKNKVCG